MMNNSELERYSDQLEFRNGLWFSQVDRQVSYPAEAHDEYYQLEDRSFWFTHRNNCIIKCIKNFPPDGSIFDVGGGNGFVAQGLENSGIRTFLVEPGIDGISNARKRGFSKLICSSFEDARFKNNSLPAIGIFDVLEHLKDDGLFISNLNEALASGGRMFVTVPAFNLLWSGEDDYAGHFRRYTLKVISDKLRAVRLEIEYATYIFSFLPIPIFFMRSIPSRLFKKTEHSREKVKQQFSLPGGIAGAILKMRCEKELAIIKRKKKIRFGSSCLLVAKKTR